MAEVIRWPRHIRERCTRARCGPCAAGICTLENLFSCSTCGGAEGDLPTDCPGERMSEPQRREVMVGRTNFIHPYGWVTRSDRRFRSN